MFHYNPSISEDTHRILNLKSGDNNNEVADYIQPTINIAPFTSIVRRGEALNSTSGTIYTTPTDKDFYLTGVELSLIKDVTATSLTSRVTIFVEGVLRQICEIGSLSLTPQENNQSLSFPFPIKVDRGTNISVTNSTNVANIRTTATIYGYTRETIKGV